MIMNLRNEIMGGGEKRDLLVTLVLLMLFWVNGHSLEPWHTPAAIFTSFPEKLLQQASKIT